MRHIKFFAFCAAFSFVALSVVMAGGIAVINLFAWALDNFGAIGFFVALIGVISVCLAAAATIHDACEARK